MRTIEPVAHLLKSRLITDSGCWQWTAGVTSKGYGKIKSHGRTCSVHRFSWDTFKREPIGPGLMVLHRCDNKRCFNPDHLFLGTHHDNMRDMREKGRSFRPAGEAHNLAKLTEGQVREIRSAVGFQREIAARYGVSASSVSMIRSGKAWAHLSDVESGANPGPAVN